MDPKRTRELLNHLNTLSDTQIAAAALPAGLTLSLSDMATTRYIGTTKLPPGPAPGVYRRADGSLGLQQVAIVRVQPQTALLAARNIVRKTLIRSACIGAACGVLTVLLMVGFVHFRDRQVQQPSAAPTVPCLIAGVTRSGVLCRIGSQMTLVDIGKPFPDGRIELSAVDAAHNSFTATRVTDRQSVVFQLDLTSSTNGVTHK